MFKDFENFFGLIFRLFSLVWEVVMLILLEREVLGWIILGFYIVGCWVESYGFFLDL